MLCKTLALLSTLGLALSASAQMIAVSVPAPGDTVTTGSDFLVEIDRPNSLTPSQEVAVVIALRPCGASPGCDAVSADEQLGMILYNGTFNPQYSNDTEKPPHQNFTVIAPATNQTGPALLSVVHLSLVGAGPFPMFETQNVTINLV